MFRFFLALGLLVLIGGCKTTPDGYLTYEEKRQAAINHYGYQPKLARHEIVGPRVGTTEDMLLQTYRYVPRDVMCFRHRVPGGSVAILCSSDNMLDYLLRSEQYGYGRKEIRLQLVSPHPLFENPVYTSFRM